MRLSTVYYVRATILPKVNLEYCTRPAYVYSHRSLSRIGPSREPFQLRSVGTV
eukprot:SAG22_NODE_419_length_10742_cov_2.786902_8_plen_53_part_00